MFWASCACSDEEAVLLQLRGVKIKKPPVLAANPVSEVPPSHQTPQLQLQKKPLKLPWVCSGFNLELKEHVSKKDIFNLHHVRDSVLSQCQGIVI